MSTLYRLALRGIETNEGYVGNITRFLNNHTKTYIEENNDEDGLSIYNNLITMFLDFEEMDLDYVRKRHNFDANIRFDIYFFNERYEAGVDLLLKLVSHLGTIGIDYLFAEDTEVFRKEKGVLSVNPKRYEEGDYLNRETIRRFLK